MAEFCVVVHKFNGPVIDPKLSGRLWATTRKGAFLEAKAYRSKLNEGCDMSDMWFPSKDWHRVAVLTINQARKYKGHTKWWKNRVTEPIQPEKKNRSQPSEGHALLR
jgi:hypothetical protein